MKWIELAVEVALGVVCYAWGYLDGRRRPYGPRLPLPPPGRRWPN